MFPPTSTVSLLEFLSFAEKLKTVIRHSYTSNVHRQESVAEHSWMLCLLALLVFPNIKNPVNQLHVLKILIIHDLVEVISGDIPTFRKAKLDSNKIHQQEFQDLQQVSKNLSPDTKKEIINLWQEYRHRKTPEARLAYALDKLEAAIQHNLADISTWDQGDYDYQPYFRDNLYDFDKYLRILKDHVDQNTMDKIKHAGQFNRITPAARRKYHKVIRV